MPPMLVARWGASAGAPPARRLGAASSRRRAALPKRFLQPERFRVGRARDRGIISTAAHVVHGRRNGGVTNGGVDLVHQGIVLTAHM